MKLFIYTLPGDICCCIEINDLSNISKQIFNAIIPDLKPNTTFSITDKIEILHNYLKDTNTIKLENYITNIYNSSQKDYILYIIKEYYYDDINRSLIDYKHWLENLSYFECFLIVTSGNLSIHEKYLILSMISKYGDRLPVFLNNDLKKDRDIVLAVVKKNGELLDYACEELKGDKEIVLAAVKQNGHALIWASQDLMGDKEIVLYAVNTCGAVLCFASEKLKGDREIVLAAIKQYGGALLYACEELKGDKEIVLNAVKRNGDSLEYASKELKGDKEIVLAAINQNLKSLIYASEDLKKDKEIIYAASLLHNINNIYF